MLALLLSAALANPLTFEAVRVVEHGKDVPRLVMKAQTAGTLTASVTCAGRTWSTKKTVGSGTRVELRLDGIGEGVHPCDAAVGFLASDGSEGDQTMSFEVASLGIIQLSSTLEDIDLARGTALVRASRDVAEAVATVIGPRGVELDVTTADVSGSELRFAFDTRGQEVVKLVVEARDSYGFRSQLELLPWSYAIPHEDVVFASASHEVAAPEVPKLDHAWAQVQQALELYGSVMKIQLYVAGYTDTVGDGASNQALSERRARAIAAWFQARGFPGPIFYQGFGESVLAVGTADETDEVRNRRAIYLLAAQTPRPGPDVPRSAWKKL